jgi:hypothetical protein
VSQVRRRRRRAAKKGHARRKSRARRGGYKAHRGKTIFGPLPPTPMLNPSKRRRRRRKAKAGAAPRRRRRGARAAARLGHKRRRRVNRRRGRTSRRYYKRKRRSSGRRAHRRYRRNPGLGGIMDLMKKAIPVLGAMIVGKLIIKQVGPKIPGLDKLGSFQGTALSIGMLLLGSVVTKKVAAIGKYKDSIMLGLGINAVMEVLTMTPLKGMLGLGDGIYDQALSDYVQTSDYVTTGAIPIDDDIALSDYITTGGLEEELGLSEELGVSEELGMFGAVDAHTVRGGVSQSAMLKQIPSQSFMEDVPARSFTRDVSSAGQGFDNPGALYAGIFRGGF